MPVRSWPSRIFGDIPALVFLVDEVFDRHPDLVEEHLVQVMAAKYLLGHKKPASPIGKSKERRKFAKEMAHEMRANGKPLIDDPAFRQRVAQLEVDLKALEITQYRVVSAYEKSAAGKPDPLSSALKIEKDTELRRPPSWRWMSAGRWRCRPGGRRRRWARTSRSSGRPGRPGERSYCSCARLDLWRHQRDPEKHADQSGVEAVMDFDRPRNNACCATASIGYSPTITASKSAARLSGRIRGLTLGHVVEVRRTRPLRPAVREEYGGFSGGAVEGHAGDRDFGRALALEPIWRRWC